MLVSHGERKNEKKQCKPARIWWCCWLQRLDEQWWTCKVQLVENTELKHIFRRSGGGGFCRRHKGWEQHVEETVEMTVKKKGNLEKTAKGFVKKWKKKMETMRMDKQEQVCLYIPWRFWWESKWKNKRKTAALVEVKLKVNGIYIETKLETKHMIWCHKFEIISIFFM